MTRAGLGIALAPLIVCACGLFGGGTDPQPADDAGVVEFADRIQNFYGSLEDVPLDALLTFESRELRSFFADNQAFSDYYAALADEVRVAAFRNARAKQVRIEEFRFDGPGIARVDLTFVGDHERGLRFWDQSLSRTDTWRQIEGVWVLAPEKL